MRGGMLTKGAKGGFPQNGLNDIMWKNLWMCQCGGSSNLYTLSLIFLKILKGP